MSEVEHKLKLKSSHLIQWLILGDFCLPERTMGMYVIGTLGWADSHGVHNRAVFFNK